MHNREIGRRIVFLHLLRRNLLRKKTGGRGLYDGQMPVLEALIAHPGCTQQELAGMLHVTPASVALSTKRLQKAGCVEKRVDENNHRRNRLYAVPAGAALAAEARRCLDEVDAESLAGFSEEEKTQLALLLERMIQNIFVDGEDDCACRPGHWKENN